MQAAGSLWLPCELSTRARLVLGVGESSMCLLRNGKAVHGVTHGCMCIGGAVEGPRPHGRVEELLFQWP